MSRPRINIPWVSVYLYAALVLLAAAGPPAAEWGEHLELVPLVALLGLIAGVALASSAFSGRLALVFAGWYGVFVTGWLLGETLDPALTLHDRTLVLLGRIRVFFQDMLVGRESEDALMAVLVLAVLYWILTVAGSWVLVRRGGTWGAVVPLGITLFVNAYYYVRNSRLEWMLAAYLLLALLLVLNQEVSRKREEWQDMRASIQSSAIPRFVRLGVQFVVFLIFLGFAVPALARSEAVAEAWSSVSGPWVTAQDQIGRALSGLESPTWIVREEFGETLTLKAGVATTNEIVLEAQPFNELREGGRFYWRARTYDKYFNGRWSNRSPEEFEFDPRTGTLPLPETDSRQEIEVSFTVWSTIPRVLYLPTQPIWASRSSQVVAEREGDQLVDVSSFLATKSVQRGERYRAIGVIAIPTEAQLRAAGTDYPEWVEERYLQVPQSVTERTRELARQIAGDLETPYDQASAITRWLRDNIEYRLVTEAPPPEGDPLDWFLFEYGIGFCNFYASAEVIMLRTLGVPARMATGYAQGAYQDGLQTYEVIASDFHAWPEVYFPGVGWVEFEPTVSQPELPRLAGGAEGGEGSDGLRPEAAARDPSDDSELAGGERRFGLADSRPGASIFELTPQSIPRLLGGFLLILIALFAFWTRIDAGWWVPTLRWLRRAARVIRAEGLIDRLPQVMEIDSLASEAYARWLAWWPRLGLDPRTSETPKERVEIFRQIQPSLASEAEGLVGMYTAERFGGEEPDEQRLRGYSGRLQAQLWRSWLRRLGIPLAAEDAGSLHDLRDL